MCKLSAYDLIIETQVYKLTKDGMKNVEECIARNGGTLIQQHDFCTKDPGVLYEPLKSEIIFVNDEIDIHMSESFINEEINQGMKTNPSTVFTGKKRKNNGENYQDFHSAKKVRSRNENKLNDTKTKAPFIHENINPSTVTTRKERKINNKNVTDFPSAGEKIENKINGNKVGIWNHFQILIDDPSHVSLNFQTLQ